MRCRQPLITVTFLALFEVASPAAIPAPVTTYKQACSLLKHAAVAFHLSRRHLSGRYYCESLGSVPEYYLLGLRYRVAADELVRSNLIGWFAVRRSDGALLDWDVNQNRAEPLAPRPPFEK